MVKDRGLIRLAGLSRSSFDRGGQLSIQAIGAFEVVYRGEGFVGVYRENTGEFVRSEFAGGGIDLRPEGAFSGCFPFALENVHDVIANYDEICKVLETWPVQPDYAHLQTQAGTNYYYWVRDPAANEFWLDPIELK